MFQVWLYCSYLCTYQYIIAKVKQPSISKFQRRMHEYAIGLISTPKAELLQLRMQKIYRSK